MEADGWYMLHARSEPGSSAGLVAFSGQFHPYTCLVTSVVHPRKVCSHVCACVCVAQCACVCDCVCMYVCVCMFACARVRDTVCITILAINLASQLSG